MCGSLHDRLTRARRFRHATQQALANHINVTQAAVSHWCAGRSEPDRDTIERIAAFLNVRPAWLAFGDGEMVDSDAAPPPAPTPTPPPRKRSTPKRRGASKPTKPGPTRTTARDTDLRKAS